MWLDKTAIALISPLGTALLLALLALLLALWRRQTAAWWLGALAVAWLWTWSMPFVSNSLRATLEHYYPPLPAVALPQAQAVVVLGGGIRPPERPGDAPDLNDASDRVWHAARLYRAGKAPLLVLSGGSDPALSAEPEAASMRQLLTDLGVPAAVMLLEPRSRNTRQNAAYTAELLRPLGVRRILLVTSALHMPRAVRLFEALGFEVLPASTDHEALQRFEPLDLLPDAGALEGSARAMKELVGRWTGR